jgi:PncC family amidohydrolase
VSDLQGLSLALFEELLRRDMTMTAAESCTGGLIAKLMTDHAGSSEVFWGSFVTYSNDAKRSLLGVTQQTLNKYGAVSEETVRSMAEGALIKSGTDCSVAVSGIAGPGGGTEDKPVGTVWVGVSLREKKTVTRLFQFEGSREKVRVQTAVEALKLLNHHISLT